MDSGKFSERKNKSNKNRTELASKSQEITSVTSSSRSHRIDFVSPLLDYGYPPAVKDLKLRQKNQMGENEKPILLYLPGFDGTYICPFIQFPELGTEFEVWCMTIGMEDRSTYKELKTIVLDFLKNDLAIEDGQKQFSASLTFGNAGVRERNSVEEMSQKKNPPTDGSGLFAGIFGGNAKRIGQKENGRSIYIAGESFGGILASDVALTLLTEQKKRNGNDEAIVDLKGVVLINPATCYYRSQLATAGPPVAKTPFPFYVLGLLSKLVPLFTDEFSLEQLFLILQAKALPSVIDNPRREAYMGRVALSLPTKLEFMPPTTLSWRLNEWLQTGCAALRDSSFAAFPNFRSLIVVGEKDKTLPSIAEAERLANKVMNPSRTKIHVVDGAGHASTCGSRLDLTAVIRDSFPELQKTSTVTRWGNAKRSQQCYIELDDSVDSAQARQSVHAKRTSMKPQAQKGYGPHFGMEERYDKADIGLNPLLYWSKSNFKSVQRVTQERNILVPKTQDPIQYKKTIYTVSD
jgi:pimeloyl-ACP methyl ester carboxylesterase